MLKTPMIGLFASSAVVAAGPLEFAPASGLLKNFFIGGSVGYLHESEDEMWHLQLGIDLQPKLAGMDQAVFLEVGYRKLEFLNVEQEIIPVTLNYKLERPLFGALSLYAGAGAGVAFYEISGGVSAEDEVFWGQVFGGLVYDITQQIELFAGVRGLFLDEVEINGFTTQSGDDLLWEVGGRFNFYGSRRPFCPRLRRGKPAIVRGRGCFVSPPKKTFASTAILAVNLRA